MTPRRKDQRLRPPFVRRYTRMPTTKLRGEDLARLEASAFRHGSASATSLMTWPLAGLKSHSPQPSGRRWRPDTLRPRGRSFARRAVRGDASFKVRRTIKARLGHQEQCKLRRECRPGPPVARIAKGGPCPAQIADNAPRLTLSTGWPPWFGSGGRFRSDWVAAFRRNRWPHSLGFRIYDNDPLACLAFNALK
jgi:hypothetical protein